MSTVSNNLSYNEYLTPNGNRYRESRLFREAALLTTGGLYLTCNEFSPSRFLIESVAEKMNHPIRSKWSLVASLVGFAIDVAVFFQIGKFVDKLITRHRMRKADELAGKNVLC